MLRVVADLGNTRLKWGRLNETCRLVESIALPLDDPAAWSDAWRQWKPLDPEGAWWAISTVNPPVAQRLGAFLKTEGVDRVSWVLSAADVPVAKDVEGAESGGADRALVVYMAGRLMPSGMPGLVVMCGTAITVERITDRGVWQGGAIMPGLGVTARALNLLTAQLPLIDLKSVPPAWGRGTRASLEAGVFWGTVGAVRELLARQTYDLGGEPYVIWTGGDASLLAGLVSGTNARIEPDLVLHALAELTFAKR
jgi:type III pantothenate kinase